MKIAFHTPLNDPDDGGTSGDRRMARQIRSALVDQGHDIETLAQPHTHVLEPDGDAFDGLLAQARSRQAELLLNWSRTAPPDAWITYHNYHKAPDLLGPGLSATLGIPYLLIEASHTRSKLNGPWARRTEVAMAASSLADMHFCFTAQDREGLSRFVDPARIVELPPFIDTRAFADWPGAIGPRTQENIRLISVAMMREGGKLASYQALARALRAVAASNWSLTLVGDGPARPVIERAFAESAPGRVRFAGHVAHAELPRMLATHDIFVWPGLREPFGLVFLEAQAAGLPVAAFRSGGVADTVLTGETALLAPEGDDQALAAAIERLMDDAELRRRMGQAARRFVLQDRGREQAGRILAGGLDLAFRRTDRAGRHPQRVLSS